MAEHGNSLMIGVISALAALITAGTSLYVATREEVSVFRPGSDHQLSRLEEELVQAEAERRRLEARLERIREDEWSVTGQDEWDAVEDELATVRYAPVPAELLHQVLRDRAVQPTGWTDGDDRDLAATQTETLRPVIDRYNQTAKSIIDSMGR